MRLMTNIFKKMLSFCVALAVCWVMLGISIALAKGCENKIVYVGDSRTVGMFMAKYGSNDVKILGTGKKYGRNSSKAGQEIQAQTVKVEKDGDYWYAQSGAFLDWLTNGISNIDAQMNTHDTIVIALGANNTGCTAADATRGAKNYIREINKHAERWIAAGKKVYWSMVTKVDEASQMGSNGRPKGGNLCIISNDAVNAFNDAVKAGLSSNIGIIDARSKATSTSGDGIHYGGTVNGNIFDEINRQACGGGVGQLGGDFPEATNNASNPYLNDKEDCSLFDLPACQKGGFGQISNVDKILCQSKCDEKYPVQPPLAVNEQAEACKRQCDTITCPKKTDSKEECEKRNAAIDVGGQYCKPQDNNASQNDDKSGQCMITKTSSGSTKGNDYCGTKGQTISADITQAIADASQKYNIPAVVLAAYIQVESGGTWNPKIEACLKDGGGGLVQFQPTTWQRYALAGTTKVYEPPHYKKVDGKWVKNTEGYWKTLENNKPKCTGKNGKALTEADRFDAYSNIMCAAVLLTDNMKATDGSLECGILAHNRGPGCKNANGCRNPNAGANGYKRQNGNCTSADYYKSINAAMQKLATQNNCSLTSLGMGGNCEYFNSNSSVYNSSGGGSTMQQVMNVVNYESNYKCNIAENYNSIKGCIFCQLFKTIYDTASSVAHQCHETFAKSLITLLAIGLAISLSFMVLNFISGMTQKDPGMLLNMVFRKCFVVIAIMALLSMDVKSFFETFISPVYTTGLKLAELAIDSTKEVKSTLKIEIPNPSPWAELNEEGFPAAMGVSMMNAIYQVQVRLEKIMAAGSNAVCIALYVESWHGYPIFPHFGYLITGLFLWLIAIVFMVTYPFLLIDSVLQFTIASSLFPVALAAMAFKITRDKLSVFKIINIFINSMFLFIFLTIVLFIILAGIDDAVADAITKTYGKGEGYFKLEEFGWYSEAFLKLVFFLFLGKAVLEDFPAFAENFAQALTMGQSAGNMDLGGKKVGGLFAGAATKAATMGGAKGAIVAGVAASYGQKMLQSAASSARNARHNYLMHRTEDKIAKAEAAGLATGGVVTGRTWWGQKVSRQVITNADGSKMLQSSRKALFTRRNTVTLADQNMSIKKKFNKDGTVRESFAMKSSLTRNLFNSDGTTNQETLNKLMQTSALPKEQVQKAIMQKMFEKRMPNLGKNTILGKLSLGRNGGLKAKYSSEQLNSYKDDNGRDVFEVRRTGKDGKVRVMRMVQGEQRTRLDYEEISSDGKSKKYSSDGLIQKKETNSYDMNRDGTLNTSTSAVINGAQVDNLKTTADGMLRDGEGNVMGRVLANGNLADAQGNIIGTAQAKDLAFGADGRCLGKMTVQGTIVDKNGNTSGYLGNNGTVLDAQGQAIGNTSSPSAYNDMLKAGKKSSKSEFSNANGYKGARLYDDDGVIEDGFADEEIMYDDSEIALYQRQMKKYGDILNHRTFGV